MTPCHQVPGSPPFETTKQIHIQGCDHRILSPGTKFPATQRHLVEEEISQVQHHNNLNIIYSHLLIPLQLSNSWEEQDRQWTYHVVNVNKNPTEATVCRHLFTAKLLYMFRVSQHPSSGLSKTVATVSGTGHTTCTATPILRGLNWTGLCKSSGIT